MRTRDIALIARLHIIGSYSNFYVFWKFVVNDLFPTIKNALIFKWELGSELAIECAYFVM